MIADLLNGVLGILLIYIAILQQTFLHSTQGRMLDAALGAAVFALALLAGKSRDAWYSNVLAPLGIALLLFTALAQIVSLPTTLESWFVFWIGVLTGVIALWGALYPRALHEQS